MLLTTQNCVSLMRLVSEMGLKDTIVSSIKKITQLENKKAVVLNEIKTKAKGDDAEKIEKVLLKDNDLRERYNSIDEEYTALMFEVIFTILERLPRAEQQFYKLLAEIKGTDLETEKGVDGGDNAEFIKEVISSETFNKFFKVFFK